MALLWADGFDEYADMNDAGVAYHFAQGWTIKTAGEQRTGRACFDGATGDDLTWRLPQVYTSGTLIVGIDMWMDFTGVSSYKETLGFRYGTTNQITMEVKSNTRNFRVQNKDASHSNESTFNFSPYDAVWAYYEFRITIGASSDGAYEVRQNGNQILAGSDVTTDVDGNGIDRVRVLATGFNPLRIDNMYVVDGNGAWNNSFLVNPIIGRLEINHLDPDGDGSTNDFVPSTGSINSNNVDEVTPNDDTDYNSADAAGEKDFYSFGDLPSGIGNDGVRGVLVSSWSANANPTDFLNMRHMLYMDSTEITGDTLHEPGLKLQLVPGDAPVSGDVGNMYPNYVTVFEENASGNLISADDVNAIEAGIQTEAPT